MSCSGKRLDQGIELNALGLRGSGGPDQTFLLNTTVAMRVGAATRLADLL